MGANFIAVHCISVFLNSPYHQSFIRLVIFIISVTVLRDVEYVFFSGSKDPPQSLTEASSTSKRKRNSLTLTEKIAKLKRCENEDESKKSPVTNLAR